ncbi:MAG: LL-diaminopimelate aminotransferase [Bacteroides sp.]|nr:LL-diaminopimelate aminotransferase [Bacteroides sp.]MBD5348749.1 LL-diaminopimelate aminotransferase [Bacteroides sp.]
MRINDNFEKMPESYLFSTVAAKLRKFREDNPGVEVIRMDIGDVTLPIPSAALIAMHKAVDDMADKSSFHGYGPEQGYDFLRKAVAENDYASRGVQITPEEIFISDGAKSDLGNLGDIYSKDSVIAVADPGYPVYVDANVIDGRGGELINGKWSNFVYLEGNERNGFKPEPPAQHADVIFLCSPSNPTGSAFTRNELKAWIDYALDNSALIIYDSAYCAYITDSDIPHSIYEIEGARKCAIEVRSFSKTAGFTGLRCGYTVVPTELTGLDEKGREVSLRKLWLRRQTTKFNGASYIIQRGAEALYSPEGKLEVKQNVDYYLANARLIRQTMSKAGFTVFGGENSPYIWVKSPSGESSWDLFEKLLREVNISCTPGVGFGDAGEGYIRLTGFNSTANTELAMKRIIAFFNK